MNAGIVIYGTDPTQAASALSMAESLFLQFGGEATKAFFWDFAVRNGERYIEDHEASIAELRAKIFDGEVTAFQVRNDEERGCDLAISFGYNVPEFGGLSFVDVQIARSIFGINKEVEIFLEKFAACMSFKYAIVYDAESSSAAYKYSNGVNLIRIFPF